MISTRWAQLALAATFVIIAPTSARSAVLFEDDFTGPLTWDTSHSSVYIKDNDFLYIETGGNGVWSEYPNSTYDDGAEKSLHIDLSSEYPIVIEQRYKLVSGGRGYVLPWETIYFENGRILNASAGFDGTFGDWAFAEWTPGETWSFNGNHDNPVPGEDYWAVTRIELTSTGGKLYVKPDDAARGWVSDEFAEVASETWSHSSIEKIRFNQPWDSINYVDWIRVSTTVPEPAAFAVWSLLGIVGFVICRQQC